MTLAYAEVIGDPIAQSKSPAIHNHWLCRLGLSAEYRTCHVTADDLAGYLAARREDPLWRGCNVTMPHKQAVIPLIDRLEIGAELVGAVNTIVPRRRGDGPARLIGSNTDMAGFLEPLLPLLEGPQRARRALVLGTGGAARAIVAGLAEHGFTVLLAGRDPAKGRALLDDIDPDGNHQSIDIKYFSKPTNLSAGDREGCFDLVVNASPLGMAGQPPLAFDFSHTFPGTIIYDIVTAPLETPLLKEARARGLRTVDGLAMLVGQAAIAFEHFFGVPPPREMGDAELRALLTA